MRTAVSRLLLIALLASSLLLAGGVKGVTAASGLTITPAALQLKLAKGQTAQTAEFTITNKYDRLVTLNFAFEAPAGAPANVDPSPYLRVRQNYVMLEPGKSLKQAVTLLDGKGLQPGSTPAELVITQTNTTDSSVGVRASIRLPLALIKEDGAVSALALSGLDTPGFSLLMPGSVTATIRNSGNVVAIPRGSITIVAPGGQVISSGAVNTASLALGPGNKLALTTPLNKVTNPRWPGLYKIQLSYGLGGGQAAKTSSAWFFYAAWWHAGTLIALMAAAYRFRKQLLELARNWHKLPRPHRTPPERTLLIGRDIT